MPQASAWISMKRWQPNIHIAGPTCPSIANWMGRCTVGRRKFFGGEFGFQYSAQIQPGIFRTGSWQQKRVAFPSHNGPNAAYLRIRHTGVASAKRDYDGR